MKKIWIKKIKSDGMKILSMIILLWCSGCTRSDTPAAIIRYHGCEYWRADRVIELLAGSDTTIYSTGKRCEN